MLLLLTSAMLLQGDGRNRARSRAQLRIPYAIGLCACYALSGTDLAHSVLPDPPARPTLVQASLRYRPTRALRRA
eukprot:3414618-Rhodomonas_salina.1